jgi:hypothetical protein
MLISLGNHGQFGNAYLSSAHLIAHALRHGFPIRLYNMSAYGHQMAASSPIADVELVSRPLRQRIGIQGACLAHRMTKVDVIHLGQWWFVKDGGRPGTRLAELASTGRVYQVGWKFRDRDALRIEIATVRRVLRLREQLEMQASAEFQKLKADSMLVIGVHVRQGDYRSHWGGKYFFDQSVYRELASQAVRASGLDPRAVIVLAFSNEPLDWPSSLAEARVETPRGSWWEDFLCLSMCDLIIGPPSTFSGAASLAGDVPWFQIKDKGTPFDPSMARPYLETGIQA